MDTPYVRIDAAVLRRNIDRMADAVRARGLALRPHVKTHKIPRIAQMQLAAGAVGLTVATIGEAEVFVAHGADDVFIAYPLWLTPSRAERLAVLGASAHVAFGVDSPESAAHAAALLRAAAADVEVLVEIDSGHHRSGVRPEAAVAVAEAARDGGLRVAGVFTFPGHSYAPGAAATAAEQERTALLTASDALEAAGFEVGRRSGGSTPSALLTADGGATEVRPGVYVFGDAQQLALGRCEPADIALTVAATVVSRHAAEDGGARVVLDAGSKILGSDRPAWLEGFGAVDGLPGAVVVALSEHHATVAWPAGRALPDLGDVVALVPNHVCLVLNLVDEVVAVSPDGAEERWPVSARGRNS
ncbi:alanine racemase [Microbacterium sp. cf332]|uniref:alanine racemase n=1 Tax=Microbacterium sp. cf332 TaxID=1761804 RepID=UPI000880D2CA|nr:alanine racemase [Microbacterium sp. cf332]SDQ28944.1 D-serine deaminase, pyridoxal phosphate-dependent [Microbacterium sp. cf332]